MSFRPSIVTVLGINGSVTLSVGEDRAIRWIGGNAEEQTAPVQHRGGGITWHNGRLTAAPNDTDDAVRFKALIDRLEITFGTIEIELRQTTGYREGDE